VRAFDQRERAAWAAGSAAGGQ